ncbi:acyl-CoA dehydrogenase family protein [Amycolatopsis sp. FDAARGOS 1241]|uniref:acyl-CoA dehydrogenase family protein n=1 Tax=Amycolatopsis sp. FDAARGOS 1241 TaxID=2778070 RepID=UPI00194E5029|nr:acyl-CoA dehydrogenase family protein [Amycolatopsis sp. FDAARGOS 1241]QRP42853.1 acyl-CoA dehydrogenase family protein [Amycolatopsis sp. FDAARGOS 1241]
MRRELFSSDHHAYREVVREFTTREVTPNLRRWDADRLIGRDVWCAAGERGVLGLGVPEEFGGAGQPDFRFRLVVVEELARAGAHALNSSFALQDDIVTPYVADLGTIEQKKRWLPGLAGGSLIGAIAMTEPDAGSDLRGVRTTAVRDGDQWVLNGQKTFITSGYNADFVIVVARTGPGTGSRDFSLVVVESGTPGFSRGRKLDKVGLHAQDTAELHFSDVRVPAANLLGTEGEGFVHLMERLPRERMSIAASAISSAQAVFDDTSRYCFERTAFGRPIGDFQNTRFTLAEIATELDVTRAYFDNAVLALNAGDLTAVDAAKAKWWATEVQKRVVDRCLQLHGGYGYMLEYPVARAFIDSRIQTIYGGTTEIMKEIIGRDIAAAHGGRPAAGAGDRARTA